MDKKIEAVRVVESELLDEFREGMRIVGLRQIKNKAPIHAFQTALIVAAARLGAVVVSASSGSYEHREYGMKNFIRIFSDLCRKQAIGVSPMDMDVH